ncbi:hypothetical protein D3C75_724250 [compost metagenome]
MRDIRYKITEHFLKPYFFRNIAQNGYRTTEIALRIQRSHMHGPHALPDMHIGALVSSLA